jgi:hypothetical protein
MPAKLVAIGDSLTHGVQSGAISRTHLSYPAIIAQCLGDGDNFRKPDFTGEGGLPLNLENLFRLLATRYGEKISWLEIVPASLTVRSFLDRIEDYWERGEGTQSSLTGTMHHNLAVLSFQLGDCDTLTESLCRRHIPTPQDDLINQITEFPMYRAARRTLNPSFDSSCEHLSQITAAKKIAAEEGGIENLIFWLGANNCLGTVIDLEIRHSKLEEIEQLSHQRHSNLWQPEHFQKLLERIAPQIDEIGANHVYLPTIPHVTIPPVSRGISLDRAEELSSDGYYEYYTHFWVWDTDFRKDPEKYPYLTREEARQIDLAIDEYNTMISQVAHQRGWHVVDVSSQLDSLAFRRQKGQPQFQFPPELIAALKANPYTKERFTASGIPVLDTRYLRLKPQETDPQIKYQGGIFSLDGIHPTTIAYGLIADNFLKVMQRETDVAIVKPLDWQEIIKQDSLVTQLPTNLCSLQDTIGFLYSQKMLFSLIKCFAPSN